MMSDAPRDPYIRRARPTRVIDGDTIDVVIDLGFNLYATHRVRLLGVDTPELRAKNPNERERAKEATDFVQRWCFPLESADRPHAVTYDADQWPLTIRTEKDDAFGRYLAEVWKGDEHLNQALLDAGHAVPYGR